MPSGVWHPDEYLKLPAYDRPTAEQPPGLFLCHRQDGRVCAGWAATHDMDECLALRIAASSGGLEDVDAVRDYETDVPVWESGAKAAAHGLRSVAAPDADAQRVIDKLNRRLG